MTWTTVTFPNRAAAWRCIEHCHAMADRTKNDKWLCEAERIDRLKYCQEWIELAQDWLVMHK